MSVAGGSGRLLASSVERSVPSHPPLAILRPAGFAGRSIYALPASCRDPSAGKRRPPQDDKAFWERRRVWKQCSLVTDSGRATLTFSWRGVPRARAENLLCLHHEQPVEDPLHRHDEQPHPPVREQKLGIGSIFSAKYKLDRLVYFERFEDVHNAIKREKEIKGWLRIKKIALIRVGQSGMEGLEFGMGRAACVSAGNGHCSGRRRESREIVILSRGVWRRRICALRRCWQVQRSFGQENGLQDDSAFIGTRMMRKGKNNLRQPLARRGIQVSGRTAAPFPPASLSGEGLEGWVAAVCFRRVVACCVSSLLAAFLVAAWPTRTGQPTLPATPLRSLSQSVKLDI